MDLTRQSSQNMKLPVHAKVGTSSVTLIRTLYTWYHAPPTTDHNAPPGSRLVPDVDDYVEVAVP